MKRERERERERERASNTKGESNTERKVRGVIESLGEKLPLLGNTRPTLQVSCEPNSKPDPSSRSWLHTIPLRELRIFWVGFIRIKISSTFFPF